MLAMLLTTLLALAILSGSIRAEENAPHVASVAVARAHIVSGVQISHDRVVVAEVAGTQPMPVAKWREAPCPEVADQTCKLLIFDMQ